MQNHDYQLTTIENAFEKGIDKYFDHCHMSVPFFCKQHFQYPGAWQTNRVAFGFDLIKMPINLLWAPIYVSLQILAWSFQFGGWQTASRRLKNIPSGFLTHVQKHVRDLIYWELLARGDVSPAETIYRFTSEEIEKVVSKSHENFDRAGLRHTLKPNLKNALEQYVITRTASADIANTLISSIVGAIALKKFTPGGFAIGLIVASTFAQYHAAGDFIFGEALGKIYYGIFPQSPSTTLVVACTLVVLCGLAIVAALSGLITDPLQHALGIHQYRLRKMIKHLKQDFCGNKTAGFHPKDQYLARIMEIFDTIKTHIS